MKGFHVQATATRPASHRLSCDDILIAPKMRADGTRAAGLRIDLGDPFFFDHPLDHIPGMLLVCGLLAVVRAAPGASPGRPGPARRMSVSLAFGSFGETGAPVTLTAGPGAGAGAWRVGAAQGERTVCQGDIAIRDEPAALGPGVPGGAGAPGRASGQAGPGAAGPSRADLVHRHRAENIVIGPARWDDAGLTVPVLTPPAGHFLSRPGALPAELLIEAARQFTTMLLIEKTGAPAGSQFVWHSLTADLPGATAAGEPVVLRDQTRNARGRRRLFEFGVIGSSPGARGGAGDLCVGQIGIEASAMSMKAFSRLRVAQGER